MMNANADDKTPEFYDEDIQTIWKQYPSLTIMRLGLSKSTPNIRFLHKFKQLQTLFIEVESEPELFPMEKLQFDVQTLVHDRFQSTNKNLRRLWFHLGTVHVAHLNIDTVFPIDDVFATQIAKNASLQHLAIVSRNVLSRWALKKILQSKSITDLQLDMTKDVAFLHDALLQNESLLTIRLPNPSNALLRHVADNRRRQHRLKQILPVLATLQLTQSPYTRSILQIPELYKMMDVAFTPNELQTIANNIESLPFMFS